MSNKSSSPLVSVVIPVYNAERFLPQCLDSLIAQTLKDIEIICVDDGSTDGSLSVLRRYESQDQRIRVLTQPNQGAAPARNHGMKYIRGEYAQFLDADDFFDIDMLESFRARARKTGADVVVCRCRHYNNATGETNSFTWTISPFMLPQKEVFSRLDVPERIFQWTIGWAWDKFYKTSFLKRHHLQFQPLQASNDLFFTFRSLICAEKISVLDRYLLTHRTDVKTSTSNTREKDPLCLYYAFRALQASLREQGVYQVHQRSFANEALRMCLWHLNTLTGRAKRTIYRALRRHIFKDLDISGRPAEYFYNRREYAQMRQIEQTPWLLLQTRRILHNVAGSDKKDGKRYFWFFGVRFSANRLVLRVRETGRKLRRSFKKRFRTNHTPYERQYLVFTRLLKRPWPRVRPHLREDTLYIGVHNQDGIGDCLEELPMLSRLKEMIPGPAEIDYFARAPLFYTGVPHLKHIYPFSRPRNMQDYDVFLSTRRLWTVLHCNWHKLRRLAPQVHGALLKLHQFNAQVIDNYALVNQCAELFGRNRREQQDMFGDFGLRRDMRPYCGWDEKAFEVLEKYGLRPGEYLTFSRGAGSQTDTHTKLWPLEYFEQYCLLLRQEFPSLPIIQLGAETRYGNVNNASLSLLGKTSPEETKVLLKYSLLHLDNDSGLMHLRAALHGKSVIVWGPTSMENVSYAENINLNARICPPCAYLTKNWVLSCPKGTNECMKAIKPQAVAQAAQNYIRTLPAAKITVHVLQEPPALEKLDGVTGIWEKFFLASSHRQGRFARYEQGLPVKTLRSFCYNTTEKTETFDHIVCQSAFDGARPEAFLQECLRMLRPGGGLYVPQSMQQSVRQISAASFADGPWICLLKEKN